METSLASQDHDGQIKSVHGWFAMFITLVRSGLWAKLSDEARAVLVVVCSFINGTERERSGKLITIPITVETIARLSGPTLPGRRGPAPEHRWEGRSKSGVHRGLRELQDKGVIDQIEQGGKGRASRYAIIEPPAEIVPQVGPSERLSATGGTQSPTGGTPNRVIKQIEGEGEPGAQGVFAFFQEAYAKHCAGARYVARDGDLERMHKVLTSVERDQARACELILRFMADPEIRHRTANSLIANLSKYHHPQPPKERRNANVLDIGSNERYLRKRGGCETMGERARRLGCGRTPSPPTIE